MSRPRLSVSSLHLRHAGEGSRQAADGTASCREKRDLGARESSTCTLKNGLGGAQEQRADERISRPRLSVSSAHLRHAGGGRRRAADATASSRGRCDLGARDSITCT
jgi:hypothetical protein